MFLHRWSSRRALVVLVTLLGLTLAVPVRAQDAVGPTADRDGPHEVAAKGAVRHSGGWGLATPGIMFGGQALLGATGDPEGGLDAIVDSAKDPRLWGGVAGSLIVGKLALAAAAAIPGGLAVSTAVALAGGFIGWELGSLNIADADWSSIGAQVVAATGAYLGTQALLGTGMALMAGGPIALGAAVAAALVTGTVLDLLRGRSLDPPLDPADGPRLVGIRSSSPLSGESAGT